MLRGRGAGCRARCTFPEREDKSAATYGHRKAECERVLFQSEIQSVIFRPALVYGPYDTTDRLYYWLYQVQKGLPCLLPNGGNQTFSMTWVGDLVASIVSCLGVQPKNDVFNVISTPQSSLKRLLAEIAISAGKEPLIENRDGAFVKHQGLKEWTDIPLWLDCDYFTYSNKRAIEQKLLVPTTLKESMPPTWNFFEKMGWPEPQFGISEERKRMVLGIEKG
ncbi:MAG: NAD-dependent epimerase/dehydratase family protein [Bacteroidota bacterium]